MNAVPPQDTNNYLSQITQPLKNTLETIKANIPEAPNTEQLTGAIGNLKTNITTGISDTLNQFGSESEVGTSAASGFLDSNSIIAKFVFLIFVLIAFMFLANLGISLIGYFTEPSRDPYLVKGTVPGNANITIHQDPENADSVPIFRSNNRSKGLEFTWSVWLFIDDIKTSLPAGSSEFSNIFSKGNNTFGTNGVATVNNGPGVYISNKTNTIRVYMDSVNNNNQYIEITNIPLRKWFHFAVRVKNTVMDVYMNGVMSGRHVFSEVPKQNYENVLVGYNGGFSGTLSNLVYYARAVNVFELNNIIMYGPNLTQSSRVADNSRTGYYSYLSNLWYYSKL
jgi:hypothetical protein